MPEITEPITIIIPTRERSAKLRYALTSCLGEAWPGLRVLVCDNCSQDDTAEVVASFKDPRLGYVRTERRLSMSDNWEFALNQVQEGFVTIIGDDDAVLPGRIQYAAELLHETGAQALRPWMATYYWDCHPAGHLRGLTKDCGIFENRQWLEGTRILQELASTPDEHTRIIQTLPSVYHGIVHTRVVETIRKRDGRFLNTNCPDLYSAIVIAAEVPKFLLLSTAVTLNAMSGSSNGGSWVPKAADAKPREVDRFWQEGAMPFHERLVEPGESRSVESVVPIMTADQFLTARDRDKRVPPVDLKQVAAACLSHGARVREKPLHEAALKAARMIASRNGFTEWLEPKIQEGKFKEREPSRDPTHFDARIGGYTTLDLQPLGATDACTAARLIIEVVKLHHRQRDELAARPSLSGASRQSAPASPGSAGLAVDLVLEAIAPRLTGRVLDLTVSSARRSRVLSPPSLASDYLHGDAQMGPVDALLGFLLRPNKPLPVDLLKTLAPGGLAYFPCLALHHETDRELAEHWRPQEEGWEVKVHGLWNPDAAALFTLEHWWRVRGAGTVVRLGLAGLVKPLLKVLEIGARRQTTKWVSEGRGPLRILVVRRP